MQRSELWDFPKEPVCSCLFGQMEDYERRFVEIICSDMWKVVRCIIKQERKKKKKKIEQAVNL